MRWLAFIVAVACPLLACGGSSTPAPMPSGPPAGMVAPAAAADDVVVAQVGGRPVWGSCVATQIKRSPKLTRDGALRECIDFELLAQLAETRGLATTRDVIDETRRALVSRLVETDFERRHRTPADLEAQVQQKLARNAAAMTRPELRASMYVRVLVPDKAPADVDQRARAVAEKIQAALANETGLFPSHVSEVANKVAQGMGVALEIQKAPLTVRGQTVPTYDEALFGIPEVGRISPAFRTQWGWDVVLMTDRLEAKQFTRDEVVPALFNEARREEFIAWADSIRTSLGVTVLKSENLLDTEVQ